MIRTAIQTPRFDPDAVEVAWETLVELTVMDGELSLDGDAGLLDFGVPIVNLRNGETIRYDDDPEEWVRFLPSAYRSGDLVAVVLEDDHPLPEGHVTPDAQQHAHNGVGA